MTQMAKLALVMLLFAPAAAFGEEVKVFTKFAGASGPGPKDCPDNSGAVGPSHVVDFTNASVVIHDKETGKVVKQMTQTEFWKAANSTLDLPTLNDPRLIYDPLSERWFGAIAEFKKGSVGYFAVSQSSDPTKGWRAIALPMEPTDPGIKLGVDKNGLYIAYTALTGNVHTMLTVYAIPKADAIATNGPSLEHLQTFPNLEIDCFPATDLDPDKPVDAPEVVFGREFGNSFSKLYMYKITWKRNSAQISELQTIPLSKTYQSPNGSSLKNRASQPAPGGKLRADEARRTTCVFAHKGSLFACNGAKRTVEARPGIFWSEVRARDGALLQEGFVDDAEADYLIPTLAVDTKGNVGLGCTRTSEKEFPSAAVMMRSPSDPENTMRPPVIAAKGTSVFASSRKSPHGLQWGNYNATCVDPSDPTIIWTYQEYAASGEVDHWTTYWVAFGLK